ncbi:hypothetical protein CAL7716_107380 (plasmid) [Calothrix sp. PCC 7716]|nr:hypothetical protein CAL7716_107380 [Calothrix sp. PCC 7716]
MPNINKKSPCFQNVAGVQDISHESAAACSGGTLILFDGTNGTGESRTYTAGGPQSIGTLLSFNNRASSFQVAGNNTWRVYSGQQFSGASVILGGPVGQGVTNFGFVGFTNFNNNVESVRRIP